MQPHRLIAGDAAFSFQWSETGLGLIPTDLLPAVYAYYLAHKYGDRPVLKDSYQFKFKFGTMGTAEGSLQNPRSVAIHPETGDYYITDTSNHRVAVFSHDGNWLRSFGESGTKAGEFSYPSGLNFDSNGDLVVADRGNSRVQILDPATGQMKLMFGSRGEADGEFSNPRGVAVDINGNLLITDGGNDRVQVFDSTGKYLRTFGSPQQLRAPGDAMDSPAGITIDLTGNIIVSEHGKNRVRIWDQNGVMIRAFQAPKHIFSSPWGIVTDRNANIVIVEEGSHQVQILSHEGELMQKWGTQGPKDGCLYFPLTPVLDREGNLIITDYSNHRVQVFG